MIQSKPSVSITQSTISNFCTKKNLLRDWTECQKLINIWSSRGLSIYGKVTIIKLTTAINGGLKMIDLESMIKSLRLAWLKLCNSGVWRNVLRFPLELFLFHCNYDFKEIHISSKFYSELLQWWSEFRSVFDSRRECQYVLWNNKRYLLMINTC